MSIPVQTWVNPDPLKCDVCHVPIMSVQAPFVDGRTKGGPWATMCIMCYNKNGAGLGRDMGRVYMFSKAFRVYVKMVPSINPRYKGDGNNV